MEKNLRSQPNYYQTPFQIRTSCLCPVCLREGLTYWNFSMKKFSTSAFLTLQIGRVLFWHWHWHKCTRWGGNNCMRKARDQPLQNWKITNEELFKLKFYCLLSSRRVICNILSLLQLYFFKRGFSIAWLGVTEYKNGFHIIKFATILISVLSILEIVMNILHLFHFLIRLDCLMLRD